MTIDKSLLVLDDLVERKEYQELERQVDSAKLSADEQTYFEGILAGRRNQVLRAIPILEGIVTCLRATHPHRATISLWTLAGDYFKLGRYADSCTTCSILLRDLADEFNKVGSRRQDAIMEKEILIRRKSEIGAFLALL